MRSLFAFILLTTAIGLSAQAPSLPPGTKYAISYTVEELSFYTLPEGTDPATLSKLDIQKTQQTRVLKSIQRVINDNGDHTTTITTLHPGEVYKSWPQAIGSMVIDQSGTHVYKPDGSLYRVIPPDSATLADYTATKTLLAESDVPALPAFPMPDSAQQDLLWQNGFSVEDLPDGRLRIQDSTTETWYDPMRLSIRQIQREGENITGTSYIRYQQEGNFLIPWVEWQETPVIRPSGICMKSVVLKRYSEYEIQTALEDRSPLPASPSSAQTRLYPNPAAGNVRVFTGSTVLQGSTLRVIAPNGRLVYQQTNCSPNSTLDVSLSELPAGLYFVQVQTVNGFQLHKLVKQQ